jgi:hypothetical protein
MSLPLFALGLTLLADAPVPPEWRTRAEASDFRATSSYEETLEMLRRIEARLPEMKLTDFGTSGAGRKLPLVVVSKDRAFTPEAARARSRPIVLIQNGIHAGEIDGKDACLMILRDLALGRRRELLDAATLVILPIYNVDGHERVSPHNRPNQDGPVEGMGFRTTATGLDLNRDHMKLASEEARALVALVNAWRPHLHVDNHVTDGLEHDWVLTWASAPTPQLPAPVDRWLQPVLAATSAATARAGHRNGPFGDERDDLDPNKGYGSSMAGGSLSPPRFSTFYFALRNRPSLLVETHSYKPFRARVLATRDFLLALLAEVGRTGGDLVRAVSEAEAATVAAGRPGAPPSLAVLSYLEVEPTETLRVPFYAWRVEDSVVRGRPLLRYERGTLAEREVPWFHGAKAGRTVSRPRGYLLDAGWPHVEDRLRRHGLRVERLGQAVEVDVETVRVSQPRFAARTYQGLTQVEDVTVARAREKRRFPPGTLWIPADQPDFEVAIHLLEPEAPDSLLSWGLLSTVFEGKEYIDQRVLEGLAAKMLEDPARRAEWEAALRDEAFARDPAARHRWWYRRTPYWDDTIGLLPAYRAMEAPPRGVR